MLSFLEVLSQCQSSKNSNQAWTLGSFWISIPTPRGRFPIIVKMCLEIPFGNHTWLAGKSHASGALNGKSSISGRFSIDMFDYWLLELIPFFEKGTDTVILLLESSSGKALSASFRQYITPRFLSVVETRRTDPLLVFSMVSLGIPLNQRCETKFHSCRKTCELQLNRICSNVCLYKSFSATRFDSAYRIVAPQQTPVMCWQKLTEVSWHHLAMEATGSSKGLQQPVCDS